MSIALRAISGDDQFDRPVDIVPSVQSVDGVDENLVGLLFLQGTGRSDDDCIVRDVDGVVYTPVDGRTRLDSIEVDAVEHHSDRLRVDQCPFPSFE